MADGSGVSGRADVPRTVGPMDAAAEAVSARLTNGLGRADSFERDVARRSVLAFLDAAMEDTSALIEALEPDWHGSVEYRQAVTAAMLSALRSLASGGVS